MLSYLVFRSLLLSEYVKSPLFPTYCPSEELLTDDLLEFPKFGINTWALLQLTGIKVLSPGKLRGCQEGIFLAPLPDPESSLLDFRERTKTKASLGRKLRQSLPQRCSSSLEITSDVGPSEIGCRRRAGGKGGREVQKRKKW